jgi:hypothetical protein
MKEARKFIGQDTIDIVVHHSPCDDGHSAASLFYYNDRKVILHGIHPKDELLTPEFRDLISEKTIIFVDIAFSSDVLTQVCNAAKKVVVLDHHITNANINNLAISNFRPVVIMDCPGVWLAWQFLFGDDRQMPKSLYYIGLKDIFKHGQNEDAVYFTTAFVRPNKWDDWIPFIEPATEPGLTQQLIEKGKVIYDYQQSVMKTMMEKAQVTSWRGFRVVILNVPYPWVSDIGAMLCQTEPDRTIAVLWNKQASGPYSVSLRSHKDVGPDIEKFAAELKGGGHIHAAACRMDRPPYEFFTDTGIFDQLKSTTSVEIFLHSNTR